MGANDACKVAEKSYDHPKVRSTSHYGSPFWLALFGFIWSHVFIQFRLVEAPVQYLSTAAPNDTRPSSLIRIPPEELHVTNLFSCFESKITAPEEEVETPISHSSDTTQYQFYIYHAAGPDGKFGMQQIRSIN